MGKALEGVRILDMTHVQSGPSCTQMLGFLGADVIKLEPPGRGDITRGQLRDIPNVDSLYFTMLNCNKRSITLNMKSAHGTEIFTELLKTSDVLVENFGPGVLDRLGFPWEAMQDSVLNLVRVKMRDHQRLQHGPLSEYPNKTFGQAVPRSGNASGGGHPGTALRCKPGGQNDYVYVVFQPQIWDRLLQVMERDDLIGDPRYSTPAARLERLDEVYALVESWTMQYTKLEVNEKLNAIDVPCGPILDTADLISDEHLKVRQMIVDVPHSQRGTFQTVGCPLKLSDS